jgi:hypothetical protein
MEHLGLREKTLVVVLLERRLHGGNQSILKRSEHGQYVRILKKILDRGREGQPKLASLL